MLKSIVRYCGGSNREDAKRVVTVLFVRNNGNSPSAAQTPEQAVVKAAPQTVEDAKVDNKNVLPYEKIPGPVSIPFFKAGWIFFPGIGRYSIDKLHEAHTDMYNRYGPLVSLKFPGQEGVVAYDPKDLEVVFRNEGEFPMHPGIEPLREVRKKYSTGGITTLNGPPWYELRSKIQPHLLRVKLAERHFYKMEEVANDMIQHIRHLLETSTNGETEDFIKDLQVWAIETVSYISLNKRLHCLQKEIDKNSDSYALKEAAIAVFQGLTDTVFGSQMWRYFPTAGWKSLVKAHDIFYEHGMKHIRQVLEDVKTKTKEDELTFLEDFLTRKGVQPEDAVIMALDLLLAGVDTTSNAMGFLLYDLARHPEIQEKARKEIMKVVADKDTRFTMKVVEDLPFLRACVKESLRLHPIVVGTARILDKEVVLSNYRIPANVFVLSGSIFMARHGKNFDKPDKYVPERWLRENKDKLSSHPYAYIPFGHGPRMCLGRRIAQNEMYILTAKILQNFKVEYHHEEIDLKTGLTTTPNKPLKYKFIPTK